MRGQASSIAKERIDHILVAARYDSAGGELVFARGYARTGAVWTDRKLYSRAELIERIRAGEKVMAGTERSLSGDFELKHRIRVQELDGPGALLLAEDRQSARDDLGLPLV